MVSFTLQKTTTHDLQFGRTSDISVSPLYSLVNVGLADPVERLSMVDAKRGVDRREMRGSLEARKAP